MSTCGLVAEFIGNKSTPLWKGGGEHSGKVIHLINLI